MTEPKPPKIFISHSAKSKAHESRLMQFAEQLSNSGLDPWVDRQRIGVGEAWNPAITKALQDCHGAVVLFSQQALQSDFVKYEVSCLAYRKRTQSGFALFPLILDETPIQTILDGFFGAIQFGDYQIGTIDEKEQEVIGKLRVLDPKSCRPVSAIEGALLEIFRRMAPEAIREAAVNLGWATWPHVTLADAESLHFVRRLLAASIPDQIKALRFIKKSIPPDCSAFKVFSMISPFWVDEDAARMLASVCFREPSRRAAVINAIHGNFTCDMFLRRARPMQDPDLLDLQDAASSDPAPLPSLAVGARSAAGRQAGADLVEQLRRALCQKYEVSLQASAEDIDKAIDREMAFDETNMDFRPVEAVQLSEFDLPLLKSLLNSFKRITFVAMTGETIPEIPADLADRVQVIEPKLQHDETQTRHNEQVAFQCCDPARLKRLGIGTE